MFELSVIIPSHNKGKYIEKCIRSIYQQSYTVFEVIVFDDMSTDNTLDILEKLKKEYPSLRVITSKENVGVSRARDYAIKEAKTEYVTFIDADDYYYVSTKLENEMRTAEEYFKKTGKVACTYSQTVLVNEQGNRLDKLSLKNWDRFIRVGTISRLYKYWLPRDYCFPKSKYIKVGGFDPNYSLYEDWDLNLRLFSEIEFKFANCYGTAYRLETGGLASVDYKKHHLMKKRVFKKNKKVVDCTVLEEAIFYLFLYVTYVKNIVMNLFR